MIVSQRMSAGSRDFQLQDGMKWSPEILFHFSNDMTMTMTLCWTSYGYVTASLLEEESDTFFQIKVKKEYFKIC